MKNDLNNFYETLITTYGPQHWWPGDTPFEVIIGAILTQNTNWTNVEKAILNLKNADVLCPHKLYELSLEHIAELIRPSGYFNIKSKRLKNFITWFIDNYNGDIDQLKTLSVYQLREELLSINGIGRETADSIILYALEKPTFVVDTYTYRILSRHGCIDMESQYEEIKDYCERSLPEDTQLYNELHALFVQIGKNHCKPRPKCQSCPLEPYPHQIEER